MSILRRLPIRFALAAALAPLFGSSPAPAEIKPLSTAVIKSTTNMCLRGKTCHRDQAGVWVAPSKIAILAVSIAEQSDLALYVDIEISTRPTMYMCAGNDSKGCIARSKYAGPGLFSYGATSGSTYLGSNITSTYMAFPEGYGIIVEKGTPIYVHLDARNGSLIDVVIDQDAWLYYVPVN
jgi:hypothetical protein